MTRNSVVSVIGFIFPMAVMIALTPFLVRTMGAASYGLWSLSLAALGAMGLFEAGLGMATAHFVSYYSAKGDARGLSASATAGFLLYSIVALVVAAPMFFLAPRLAGAFDGDTFAVDEIEHALRLITLAFIPQVIRSAALAVYMGFNRFSVPALVTALQSTALLVGALVIATSGGSVFEVIGASVALIWTTALVSIFFSIRLLRRAGARWLISKRHLIETMRFMVFTGTIDAGSVLFSWVDRLVVGSAAGIRAVTYYSVCVGIASKILVLAQILSRPLMTATSSWWSRHDIAAIRAALGRYTRVVLLTVVVVWLVALPSAERALTIWIDATFAARAAPLLRILIVVYGLTSLSAPGLWVANGIGKPWISAGGQLAGGLGTVLLIGWLSPRFGLEAAGWGNGGYLLTLGIPVVVWRTLQRSRTLS